MSGRPTAYASGSLIPSTVEDRHCVAVFASSSHVTDDEGAYVLDMAGCDLSILETGRAPVLAQHYAAWGNILGCIVRAWTLGERAFALLRFAKTEAGEEAWQLVRDGIACNVSAGLIYDRQGCDTLPGGLKLIRTWQPYEVSMVAVPKDWQARALPSGAGEGELARWRTAAAAAGEYRDAKARHVQLEAFAAFAADAVAALAQIAPDAAHAFLLSEAERFAAGKLAAEP